MKQETTQAHPIQALGRSPGQTETNNLFAQIHNEDCVKGAALHLPDKSVHLGVYDPPFGIRESKFDQLYNRKKQNVLSGYVEAPREITYHDWTVQWLREAVRVLRDDGSMYVVSGWSQLGDVLNAVKDVNLTVINHIVWKYNFGVFTTRKYVSSHYHILYLRKLDTKRVTFNRSCRFSQSDRDENGRSLQYQDMEDVWTIKREYRPGQIKNCNKLPDELVRKMVEYSSNPGDVVCDFFLGNFTSAIVARDLGRRPVGFELNPNAYRAGMQKLAHR